MMLMPDEYRQWLKNLKLMIRQKQVKAAVKVNAELLKMYWEMGKDIAERQMDSQWGSGFFEQLSRDLKKEFPDMQGFSVSNLKYVKRFYLLYNEVDIIRQQLADELECPIFLIPWWHHVTLLTKCKSAQEAYFYVQKTIENGWSRAVLLNILDTKLYEASGKSLTNFKTQLPAPMSDLAQQILKDPYDFDFLTMRKDYDERDLEDALVANITRFLLELGNGFAYVGRQVRIQVGEEEFFPDLIFFNVKYRFYMVVELKNIKFSPSHLGQLAFYVEAVNRQMKHPTDGDTIGLLICKDKDKVTAEYALNTVKHPLGISEYKLENLIPENIKSTLPTIEEIEQELEEH